MKFELGIALAVVLTDLGEDKVFIARRLVLSDLIAIGDFFFFVIRAGIIPVELMDLSTYVWLPFPPVSEITEIEVLSFRAL